MSEKRKKITKRTSINVSKKTKDKIVYISDCLNSSQKAFLSELIDSVFLLFTSYNPNNRDATLYYDVIGTRLLLNSHARKNYLSGGVIPNVPNNLDEKTEDKLIKARLEG